MLVDTTTPQVELTHNNEDNLDRAMMQVLDNVESQMQRYTKMRHLKYALDSFPDYIEVGNNLYHYSQYDWRFTLHLPDDTNDERTWRANARKIHAARKLFHIGKLTRSVSEDGSVYYSGRGWLPYETEREVCDVTLVVPTGGLPPTCTIKVEEREVTTTYKTKVVTTDCGPRNSNVQATDG